MADTKKEHYVPRCYLKHFEADNGKVQVFDKKIMQVREQRPFEVAMENYFYDIDFVELSKRATPEETEKIHSDLLKIVGEENWDSIQAVLADKKHIEKFYSQLEVIYSLLLGKVISKSYGGNSWVINNCCAFSDEEKELLSFFIAIQIIRTKTFREDIGDMIEKLYQTLAYKSQMFDKDAIPKEEFKVSVDKDFVKLQHSSMILDPDMTIQIAETLYKHIWVVYVNKTNHPFYTSDDPVARIPHKHDKYMSYSGLSSEGIEIVFPISPNLLLAMYDTKTFSSYFSDRKFIAVDRKDLVDYFNQAQVYNSYRCIFSQKDNFDLATQICKENPIFREQRNRIEVT